MSSEPLISARNLGKAYRLYANSQERLKDLLFGRFGRSYGKAFWAVRGVSFEVHAGEMLAIIGRNGSGKSTLLQMLAGTLRPTEGSFQVRGRLAALLELGSGFHPEFTGRENIYINGAILGLSRREIEAKIDDIIAFADIGDFIDQPVRYYSSGMFVRLAFAVSTGLEPDVLLVDEALAVGDVFFKQKCYHRLRQLLEQGTAVLLVTHNMTDVEMFAHKAILLHQGRVVYQGPSSEAVRQYFLLEQQEQERMIREALGLDAQAATPPSATPTVTEQQPWPALRPIPPEKQVCTSKAVCRGILLTNEQGQPAQVFRHGDTLHAYYEFEVLEDLAIPIGSVAIYNDRGVFVHGMTDLELDTSPPRYVPKGSRLRYHQKVVLNIAPGEYTLECGLAEILPSYYEQRNILTPPSLRQGLARVCHAPKAETFRIVTRSHGEPAVLFHRGLCYLPGDIELRVVPPTELSARADASPAMP